MKITHTIEELRSVLRGFRAQGERIAFIPTMGDLHAGHLSLVREGKKHAERTVVSIFVNPLQFGANEDFDAYPRMLEQDAGKLTTIGADVVFAPSVLEVYPAGRTQATSVHVAGLSDILCGAARPGHFSGVATVVSKLFNIVGADVALFGEKDFQQLRVIQTLVADLCFPVRIIPVPTMREPDGLALSSRNRYLTPEERQRAPALYRALRQVAEAITPGRRDYKDLCRQAAENIAAAGFRGDYIEVRRASDLLEPAPGDIDLVVLAAAWLGRARLIDNIQVRLRDE